MRVLITGASGFIGRHVVAAVAGRGHDIVVLQHRSPLPAGLEAVCERVVQGDVRQSLHPSILKGIDVICHLAAYIPNCHDDPGEAELCFRSNAMATLCLAQAAQRHGVCRFVYISGVNVFDDSGEPVMEAPYYLVSKMAGEIYLSHVCWNGPTKALTLRIGTPYGHGSPERSVVATFMRRAARGQILNVLNGGVRMYNFVYVNDVAQCIANAIESGESGTYNVSSGEHTSLAELASCIAGIYSDRNVEVRIEHGSNGGAHGFPAMSIEKARKAWGFEPLRLRPGLEHYRAALAAEAGKP